MHTSIKPDFILDQHQKKGQIEGYASFFEVLDQHREKIAKGAFMKTLRAWKLLGKTPKMLWQHDPRFPIGIWKNLFEDENGLYVKGQLTLGVKKADEAYLLLKEGVLDNLSIGFRTIEAIQDKEHKTRILLDIDLIEISLVTFGANSRATVQHVKFW